MCHNFVTAACGCNKICFIFVGSKQHLSYLSKKDEEVLSLSCAYITVGDSNVSLSLALGPFMMILASYRLLRNYKDSLLWLVATTFVTMVACLVASESSFYDKFEFLLGLGLIFGAFGFLLLIMALFVPYRKRPSVWVGMTGRSDHKGTDIWKLIMIVMLLLVLILNVFVFAEVI